MNIERTLFKIIVFFTLFNLFYIDFYDFLFNRSKTQEKSPRTCMFIISSHFKKSVLLYTSETNFNIKTNQMCQCFVNSSKPNEAKIDSQILANCSKKIIFEWIMPSTKFKNKDSELCFKNSVYEEMILPLIIEEQNRAFNKGIFKNDLLYYRIKERQEKNRKYQYFFKKCANN